jgi:hypothetical protein
MFTIMIAELLTPNVAYALTSGPTTPEASSFQQAGVTDMVDLFTGNFNYNLPVMDIDGYPLNLSYAGGSGMDDEASWVGYGWNINVGAITRQLRGIPDDMSGEAFETEHYTKPKVTVGGRVTAKMELKGAAKDLLKVTGSFTLGVFSDNYSGIGAELGANAGISASFTNGGSLTAGMGIGLLSSTQSGVDVTPSLSLSYSAKINSVNTTKMGVSATLGYNTRAGLKSLTLGSSFSVSGSKLENETRKSGEASYDLGGSTISYNSEPISPEIQIPYRSFHESYSFDIGGAAWLVFAGGGATGYRTVRQVKDRTFSNPAYGFLYADRGKDKPNAMMDMQREKESMVIPELPNIAVPIHTPDLFSFTSQAGSGQFRLYRGGTGILFDNEVKDVSNESTAGFDAGVGAYAHGGVSLYTNTTKNVTRKWKDDNHFKTVGDFEQQSTTIGSEPVYFKQVGEKNLEDVTLYEALGKTDPVAVKVDGKLATKRFRKSDGTLLPEISSTIKRDTRAKRRQAITYLTAKEATKFRIDNQILSYDFNTYVDGTPFTPQACHSLQNPTLINRIGADPQNGKNYRESHHISEITVTDESGKRNVYGLPVYNVSQSEYSFALGGPSQYKNTPAKQTEADQKNLATINTPGGTSIKQDEENRDSDHYFHRETQPGYATSYLLTGILSPDYVDVSNNGITDDDLGTAIKFNYSRTNQLYTWRSPYNNDFNATTGVATPKANISKALLANPDDDKGSVVIGEKELWYIHSIETKTKIAYFITGDRWDALGVTNLRGDIDKVNRQKLLREIRLYSKADLTRPIKVVKLNYDYSISSNLPNFNIPAGAPHPGEPDDDLENGPPADNKGKLTLKSVYFLYGNSPKGKSHPYVFHYNNTGEVGGGAINQLIDYGYLLSDRWGTYKPAAANTAIPGNSFPLRNDEFPYTNQQNPNIDIWAAAWQLSRIELPTGGEITVHYESDDYAYVQNKRAMTMMNVVDLIKSDYSRTDHLRQASGLKFKITGPDATRDIPLEEFKSRFLNGSEYMYTKLYVDVAGYDSRGKAPVDAYFDFVPTYAKVKEAKQAGKEVSVIFEEIKEDETANPIQIAAWQKMKLEYPRYSYPGYRNRVDHKTNVGKAISAALGAIVDAARTLDELKRSFYNRASDLGFANRINVSKSFVRAVPTEHTKKGGGSRVKKILISDKWNVMSGNGGITKQYGQYYDYTMLDTDGKTKISSGVASFEPGIGNDENPLRLPIPYVQKIKGALNNFYQLEEPFGESLFPGASVGYRRITVSDLDENGNPDPGVETGYVVNEFYTSKEFPVITRSTPNKVYQNGPSGWYSLFGSSSFHDMVFSQGYSIELNDMHGKPKATRVFNKAGSEVSSTVYHYNSEPYNAGELRLKNEVNVVDNTGKVTMKKIIGREIEMFTDMREQESNSNGQMMASGVDVFPIPIISAPAFWPHWPYKENDSYKLFRSASTLKVVQYYGVIEKVVKTVDGSSMATENLVYDELTGEPVITRTLNEFERPVYSVNLPAYWLHPAMGAAYKSLGTFIPVLQVLADGVIGLTGAGFLNPGDELLNLDSGQRLWVIESPGTGANSRRLIDVNGLVIPPQTITVKVLRSAYRNQLTAAGANIVCQKDPVKITAPGEGRIVFSERADQKAYQVLTASAVVYDEDWGMRNECATCPEGYRLMPDGNTCESIMIEDNARCYNLCSGAMTTAYGQDGARIQSHELAGSPVSIVKNHYYGGNCTNCATLTSNQINGNAILAAVDSSVQTNGFPPDYGPCVNNNPMPNPDPDCTVDNLCGRLNAVGIWPCTMVWDPKDPQPADWYPIDEWIAVETCLDITTSGWYYFGYAADDHMRILINDAEVYSLGNNLGSNFREWNMQSRYIVTGKHKLKIEFMNKSGHGSVAMEVYKENRANVLAGTINPANIIFSTRNLIGAQVQVFKKDINTGTTTRPRFKCSNGSLPDACNFTCGKIPVNRVVNPYVKGFKGNWRPSESKAYLINRKYKDIINQQNPEKEVDVKNAGNLENFNPYWYYDGSKWQEDINIAQWVTSNTITLYDKYGQELENKDALGRNSGAIFVFNGQIPGAVANNARNREIFYESFEDSKFRQNCLTPEVNCNPTGLRQNDNNNSAPNVISALRHSGNYAAEMGWGGLIIKSTSHQLETKEISYLTPNNKGEYALALSTESTGIYPNGFEPYLPSTGSKEYIFSAWIYDGRDEKQPSSISLLINGQQYPVEKKAVVEKWKLVEGKFPINAGTGKQPFSLQILVSLDKIKIDDIRIQPFDALMKSYAYDEKTLRLMAEMDENNFATFYEYDDEGGLVRLKKETERGIMTIKENRSAKKKFKKEL